MNDLALKLATSAPPNAVALAQLCKAAADPRRLEILRALSQDSFGVLELCRIFDMRQPAMSHHLKVLAEASLVCRRREANNIFYRRGPVPVDSPLGELFRDLMHTIDGLELPTDALARLDQIQTERAAASRAFFAANASRLAAQQDMIAAPDHYLDTLLQLLDGPGRGRFDTVLELGPGTGWLLPDLARRARHVIAVDSADEMLESSRQTCAAQRVDEVTLVHGDNSCLARFEGSVDLAVVNMVLHHTPSPVRVLGDLARTLRPGGALLVCELGAHDQAWVRDACGDFWLGFTSDDLEQWASGLGLRTGDSAFLALRNGFQIQIHLYFLPESRE